MAHPFERIFLNAKREEVRRVCIAFCSFYLLVPPERFRNYTVMDQENPAEVLGLLPPHEQMLDLATYGPVLIAKEECERNYAGEVVVVDDKEVDSQVVELLGPSAQLIFPCESSLRYLVIQCKNIGKYCGVTVEVVDHKREKRQIHMSNNQSKIHVTSHEASIPMRLKDGWNYLCLDLKGLTKNAFGTIYQRAICVQIFSSCRVWRAFFQGDRYADVELPPHLRTL